MTCEDFVTIQQEQVAQTQRQDTRHRERGKKIFDGRFLEKWGFRVWSVSQPLP